MRLSKALVTILFVLVAFCWGPSAQTPRRGRFVADEILVKFRPGANASAKADVHRQGGGSPLNEFGRTGVQRVAVPAGGESAAIARYRQNPNVVYSEPNFIRSVPAPNALA